MHKQTYRYEAIKYPSNEDVFFNVLWHNRDYTAPHWHNGLEILYLLEGSEDCYLGEEECIRMKKGDFLVINSRVVHSVQCPDTDPLSDDETVYSSDRRAGICL